MVRPGACRAKRRCLLVRQAPRAHKLVHAYHARDACDRRVHVRDNAIHHHCISSAMCLTHMSRQPNPTPIKYIHNTTSLFPLATQQPHPPPPLTTTNTQSITTTTNTTQQQQQQNTPTTQNHNKNKKSNNSPMIFNFNL